jgi:hypothetical protein
MRDAADEAGEKISIVKSPSLRICWALGWTVSSAGLRVLVGKFPASPPVEVEFNYEKNRVYA